MRVHAALLAIGNESAMNLEPVGGVYRHIYCFAQHFCTLGVNFAENLARPNKLHQGGSGGPNPGGGIIRPRSNMSVLCMLVYEPAILYIRQPAVQDRGYA